MPDQVASQHLHHPNLGFGLKAGTLCTAVGRTLFDGQAKLQRGLLDAFPDRRTVGICVVDMQQGLGWIVFKESGRAVLCEL